MSQNTTKAYVIGIDIGGTFTDAVATDESGRVVAAKAASTPPNFAQGMLDAIREVAQELALTPHELLKSTRYICHATTSTLNALVTGNVAKVGFLTTKGHADSITIMNTEGRYAGFGPEELQDMVRHQKPLPLVPRHLVREITERIDFNGDVVVALDEAAVRHAVQELLTAGVEAIAVSLLWSFRNPTHERRVRELVHELAPQLYVGISSEVIPRIREYSRAATTIMSAQVGPILRDYLRPLTAELTTLGFNGSLLVMQGTGGSITAHEAPSYAVTTIGSVLTGGVIGCVNMGSLLGHRNIISTDMGGTTFLVGMVVDGVPVKANTTVVNQHTISTPMVRINTIGGGGGAVAWLDDGGNLRVGPRGAGAAPGPAAYALGGTEPTVTDADIILGIINPEFFLGGRKRLDRDLAERAIRTHIAEPLGLSVENAAAAIYAIATAQAADLVRKSVVNAGYDPREFVVYAFGGAAPAHCAAYAAELNAKELVVPLGPTASAFSAYGLAGSNVVLSAEQSNPQNFPPPTALVNDTFQSLEADLRQRLAAQNIPFSHIELTREVDIRYTLQLSEVTTPVSAGDFSDHDVARIGDDFETLYEQLYGKGAGYREAGLQIISYRVFGVGYLPFKPVLPDIERKTTDHIAPKSHRRVLLDITVGWQDTPIYDYADLRAGHELAAPAIIEAPTTTVVVPPGARATVDRLGNLIMRFQAEVTA